MTFKIFEANHAKLSTTNDGEFSSIEAAKAYVSEHYAKVLLFIDEREEGDGFDFATRYGVYACEAR